MSIPTSRSIGLVQYAACANCANISIGYFSVIPMPVGFAKSANWMYSIFNSVSTPSLPLSGLMSVTVFAPFE